MQISVVIPLYNKCKTIRRALESVFAQSVQPLEIIVVNDGSTDGSERMIEPSNSTIIRLAHQTNAGVSAARNKGIEMANGDWIAFLDADDEWKPDFLETMQLLARTYPQCSVVACAYLLQDHRGNPKPIVLHKIPFIGEHGVLTNYFEVASCSHPPLWTSAIVARKEALQSIGGFPVGIKSGEDLLT
jgi:glycosyltransferase involved in cell wall biosynthesis